MLFQFLNRSQLKWLKRFASYRNLSPKSSLEESKQNRSFWVSPQDNSVCISDYDMWHLAKFAPRHPVIRNRTFLRVFPPQVIERFLGDLNDGDAGDTYRYPSDYSWDSRHDILIESLDPSCDADGRYFTYAYSAWYCQSLSNQVKTYHNVAVSSRHLPVGHIYVDPCKTSAIANILNTSNDPLKDAENAKGSKCGSCCIEFTKTQ
ncbi:hypothetical protein GEMRC1_006810 [Eukaryota sp. GEM-RC1]